MRSILINNRKSWDRVGMDNRLQLEGHKLIYHLDAVVKWLKGKPFYPLHIDIGASSVCNYRCAHCFYDYLGHKAHILERERLLKLMRELAVLGVKSVYFASNGEPLENRAVPEAIIAGKKWGLDIALSTNGVNLDRVNSPQVLKCLSWVRVSCLAASLKKYCRLHRASQEDYRKLWGNIAETVRIKKKNKLPLSLGMQMCLLAENGREVPLLAKKARAIGLDYLAVRPVSHTVKNKFQAKSGLAGQFAKELEKAQRLSGNGFQVTIRRDLEAERKDYDKCYGLPFIGYIAADGGVYACACFLEEKKYLFGNIYRKSFKEVWDSKKKMSVMERVTRKPDFKECDIACRHHAINKFLNQIKNPPAHVNFI